MKTDTKNIYLLYLLIAFFMVVSGDAYAADVFDAIRQKAFVVVKRIGALATLIAAFGLIGFAFGAIFGKISWKWFGNLAIGLFLVANVGLFIDYFATMRGESGQYSSLGYGSYLNSSSGNTYTETSGTDGDPSSQNSGTGGSSGQNDSNDLASGDCVPGTGVGCGGTNGSEQSNDKTSGEEKSKSSGEESGEQKSEWEAAGLDMNTDVDGKIDQLGIDTSGISDTLAAMQQAEEDAAKKQQRKENAQKVLSGVLDVVNNLNQDGKILGFMDDSTNEGKIKKNVADAALTGVLGGLTNINNQSLSEGGVSGQQAAGEVSKNVIGNVLNSVDKLNDRGRLTQGMDADTTGEKVKKEAAEAAIDGLIGAVSSANQTIGQTNVDGVQLSQDASQSAVDGMLGRLSVMNKQGTLVENIGGDSNNAGTDLLQGATKEVISNVISGTQNLSNQGFKAIERQDGVGIDMSNGGQQDLLEGAELGNVDVTIGTPEQLEAPSL